MTSKSDDEMERNTNSLGTNSLGSSDAIEQVTKKARLDYEIVDYSGPSDRADHPARMPPGHTWTCCECKQDLSKDVGVNNVPLCHCVEDLKMMGLPVWLNFSEVWSGTYCNCITFCDSCLDQFYNELVDAITDINGQEMVYEAERRSTAESSFSSFYYNDPIGPSGNARMPTRQLRALMRTVLVQLREAVFSIICNRDKNNVENID